MVGTTPKTYFRLGYGFARSRNGAHNMHAALCIPSVTGAWLNEGGGGFHNNGAIYHWNKSLIEGLDVADASVRVLDQSRIGAVLTGDPYDIKDGPPVTALFVQNMNPVQVAPEQRKVKAGFAREDLFVCVHEQFMTATAQMADVVLPATMFLEHDDVYQGGGHQNILLGPKLIETPGECRSNHEVICALAKRVGAEHRGFEMTPRQIIDWTLQKSGWGTLEELEAKKWLDCQPEFDEAHYIGGFRYPDKKFRFKPDWTNVPAPRANAFSFDRDMPGLPDHWDVIEKADDKHPFRLATSPAREYLNSSFNEMPTSRAKHGPPRVKVHPEDLAKLGVANGGRVRMGNERGEITLAAEAFPGVQPRRRHRREHRPQRPVRGRRRHQHADQRLSAGALRRRAVPRQPRVAAGTLMSGSTSAPPDETYQHGHHASVVLEPCQAHGRGLCRVLSSAPKAGHAPARRRVRTWLDYRRAGASRGAGRDDWHRHVGERDRDGQVARGWEGGAKDQPSRWETSIARALPLGLSTPSLRIKCSSTCGSRSRRSDRCGSCWRPAACWACARSIGGARRSTPRTRACGAFSSFTMRSPIATAASPMPDATCADGSGKRALPRRPSRPRRPPMRTRSQPKGGATHMPREHCSPTLPTRPWSTALQVAPTWKAWRLPGGRGAAIPTRSSAFPTRGGGIQAMSATS